MSQRIEAKHDGAPRVPFRTKVAWGSGGLADNFLGWSIAFLALPIYNIALGVDPVLIGIILAVPRVMDAFLDPLAGNLSDNTRSRWGRRRPWILGAGLAAAIFYVLAWMPPLAVDVKLVAVYILITTVLYMCAYSFFTIPYSALGIELSEDYHERTSIMSARLFFAALGQIIMTWMLRASVWVGERSGPAGYPHPELLGIRWVGGLVGLIIVLCVLLPVLVCREKAAVQTQEKIRLGQALRLTMKNRAFLLNAGTLFTAVVGLQIVSPIGYYLGYYYVFTGDIKRTTELSGWCGMCYGVMGIVLIPVNNALSRRYGKKTVLLAGQALTMLGAVSTWFLVVPAHPWWGLIPNLLIATGQPAIWLLLGSIGADICDLDELDTGLRREGMYGAVTALIFKCGLGLSSLTSGYLLFFSGLNTAAAKNGIMPTMDVILRMRLLYVAVPVVLILLGMVLTAWVPVTEKRMLQVRSALNARRRQIQVECERTSPAFSQNSA